MERSAAEEAMAGWPEERRRLAAALTAKYGEPDEATPSRLEWVDNLPWKRTVLYRDAIPHDFPVPHEDVLEQTIDYRVPLENVAALLAYDGSMVVRRTAGELSAFCSNEEYNFLSVNLADEIVKGRTDVSGARRQYGENTQAEKRGEMPPLMHGFTFSVMRGGTADRGEPVL